MSTTDPNAAAAPHPLVIRQLPGVVAALEDLITPDTAHASTAATASIAHCLPRFVNRVTPTPVFPQ
jgi:hypothetical protein